MLLTKKEIKSLLEQQKGRIEQAQRNYNYSPEELQKDILEREIKKYEEMER